jgi:hypothetical protein
VVFGDAPWSIFPPKHSRSQTGHQRSQGWLVVSLPGWRGRSCIALPGGGFIVGRWAIELNTPIAAVFHGHCGLLALRDSEGRWPFEVYRMTCFSHAEELVKDMAGRFPFVLELELSRLGGIYEKAETIWDSHVIEDRNLLTGQNPYSAEALADAIIKRLDTATN